MTIRHLLGLCTLLAVAQAQAITTLEFTTPDGIVGPNDIIEVWVRISTDTGFELDASDPDGDMSYSGAINPNDVPTTGITYNAGLVLEFDEITDVYATLRYGCGGTFTSSDGGSCDAGPNYELAYDGDTWAPDGILSLAPGESVDTFFTSLIPGAGGAAQGTYHLYTAAIVLGFTGLGTDEAGNQHTIYSYYEFASTCESFADSCAFSRTVVPVPASAWLFLSAIIGLLNFKRRGSL